MVPAVIARIGAVWPNKRVRYGKIEYAYADRANDPMPLRRLGLRVLALNTLPYNCPIFTMLFRLLILEISFTYSMLAEYKFLRLRRSTLREKASCSSIDRLLTSYILYSWRLNWMKFLPAGDYVSTIPSWNFSRVSTTFKKLPCYKKN